MSETMSGAELIAAERLRQTEEKGYLNDDQYVNDELRNAASAYLICGDRSFSFPSQRPPQFWPWKREYWKPSKSRIRNLVKAGALIAAEIDRLQRRDADKG